MRAPRAEVGLFSIGRAGGPPRLRGGRARARARARAKYPKQFVFFDQHFFLIILPFKSSKIRLNCRDVNFQHVMGTLMLPFNSIYNNAPEHRVPKCFSYFYLFSKVYFASLSFKFIQSFYNREVFNTFKL